MLKNCARKLLILLIATLGVTSITQAQNGVEKLKSATDAAVITKDPNDTTKMTWKTGGLLSLTFNQAALSNWSAGGDKSALSLNALVNLYAQDTGSLRCDFQIWVRRRKKMVPQRPLRFSYPVLSGV